jgi:glycosyltransferase involved in cell wall biosynthesis
LRTVAILPWGDRFEDFYDKIGVSLDAFRDEVTGTWLFNYVRALQVAGVRPVLYLVSARVHEPTRMTHRSTGASIRVLPAPWLHRKLQGARDRLRIRAACYRSLLSYAATPWRALAAEVTRDGCDAILCQEYEYPRFDEALIAGHVLGLPVFATYQAGNAPGSALERPFRRLAIRRAAGLMIGSQTEAARVRARYGVPPSHIALVPNTLDVAEWRPGDRLAARTALGIARDATVVVWHGRVQVHYKGLDVLLDAWKQIRAARPHRQDFLLLVGSGQDREILRRRLSAFAPGDVRWVDRWVQEPGFIRQCLAAADVATLSSRHEGFAVSVIEAMACGLPVVATDVSGVAEALGRDGAGVVVPPEDSPRLAAAIARLLDDEPLRRRLGEQARRRAEQEFSLEAVGGRIRAFMEERGAFR